MDACKLGVDMINEKQLKPFHSTYKSLTSKALVRRGLKEALELLVPLCSFCFFFECMNNQGFPRFLDSIIDYLSKTGTA